MTVDAAELYLDLMKRCLTRSLQEDGDEVLGFTDWRPMSLRRRWAHRLVPRLLPSLEVAVKRPYAAHAREFGLDWPARAETMVGLRRLDNLQHCIRQALTGHVPGDLVETGVWRGGAVVFMRAALEAYGDEARRVWAADSFCGLPPPDAARYPADAGDVHHSFDALSAGGVQAVQDVFRRYGLLDDRVRFLVGWFSETLPAAPIEEVAVLRLDGDMYESTVQALDALYPKVTDGGFCIVDEYHALESCKQAVLDYRAEHGVTDPILEIDGTGVYWQKVTAG